MLEPTDEDYIEDLLERLRQADEREQWHAINALARLGRRAAPALLEVLRGEDWTLRRHAASVFAEAPDVRAIPLLCEALGDWDWEVRREAARALKASAPPEAAEALLPLLADGHPRVCQIAIETLSAIQERDTEGRVPPTVWEQVIPALCVVISGAEWRLHVAAARLLGTLQASAAIDALWAALGTSELEAALCITAALGQIGDSRAVEPLRVALTHREADVRASAARALGCIGGEEALMLLAWALRSRDPYLRRGATQGVKRLAREGPTPALRAVLGPLRRLASPLAWPPPGPDRALFLQVLQQVELVTTQVRDLPLPSLSGGQTAQLPLPADRRANTSPEIVAGANGRCLQKRGLWTKITGWAARCRKRLQRYWVPAPSD